MDYSLKLTQAGADKLAAAIGGGASVSFNELAFTEIEPAFNIGTAVGGSGGTNATISSGQYSAGSMIPGFIGWALNLYTSGMGTYGPWISGEFNGVQITGFPSLPNGFYYAEYSDWNGGVLLIPFLSETDNEYASEYGGSAITAHVSVGETISYEVARVPVSSVVSAGDVTTLSGTIPSDNGGFNIRGVYLTDIDGVTIGAAAFPATYKPAGLEGGTASITAKIKITLSGVGSAVVNIEAMDTVEQQLAAAPQTASISDSDFAAVSDSVGVMKRITFANLWRWIKSKLRARTIYSISNFSGCQVASSGGGTASTAAPPTLAINCGTTLGGYYTAKIGYYLTVSPGLDRSTVNFAKPHAITFDSQISGTAGAAGESRYLWPVEAAYVNGRLNGKGMGFLVENGNIYGCAHDGTTHRITSSFVFNGGSGVAKNHSLRAESDGSGTVSFYVNGGFLGSLAGPVGTRGGVASAAVNVECLVAGQSQWASIAQITVEAEI